MDMMGINYSVFDLQAPAALLFIQIGRLAHYIYIYFGQIIRFPTYLTFLMYWQHRTWLWSSGSGPQALVSNLSQSSECCLGSQARACQLQFIFITLYQLHASRANIQVILLCHLFMSNS